jgi:hypothetical protein
MGWETGITGARNVNDTNATMAITSKRFRLLIADYEGCWILDSKFSNRPSHR